MRGRNGEESPASFQVVFDTRKRKVPGLWLRGSRYYAQLRVDLGNGRTAPRRIVLDADSLDKAKAELERIRTARNDHKLPARGHRPKFEEFAADYLNGPMIAQKKVGTQANERQALARWVAHIGGVRVDKITPAIIHSFREKRLAACRTFRATDFEIAG